MASIKGLTKPDVAKLNTSPNAMLMGKAGRAFLKMAKSSRVKQRPIKIAMKHARVVFQSPGLERRQFVNKKAGYRIISGASSLLSI